MIEFSVCATSKSSVERAKILQKENRPLRKASFEMCMAFECLDKISQEIKSLQKTFGSERITFICGTSHGSLYATKDFLTGLAKTNRARPFLFQNSLHNSITGFLCQQFDLKGPSFTISTGDSTGESCLELASDLIASDFAQACIVLTVDGLVEGFNDVLQTYVKIHSLTEGAGALIISTDKLLEKCEKNDDPKILSHIKITEGPEHQFIAPSNSYYDSNCIEQIVMAIDSKTDLINRHLPISEKTSEIKLNFY